MVAQIQAVVEILQSAILERVDVDTKMAHSLFFELYLLVNLQLIMHLRAKHVNCPGRFCSFCVLVFIFKKLLVKQKLQLSDVDVKLVDNSSLSKLDNWISLIMLMKYLRLAPLIAISLLFYV